MTQLYVLYTYSRNSCGFTDNLRSIVFRAFQGMGGSGQYSLVFVILVQIVPMDKLGMCTGILSSCFALASLLGPILGGVISDNTTWRVRFRTIA